MRRDDELSELPPAGLQGIGDLVNTFRADVLNLKDLSMRTGPGLVDTLKVPWMYCMSPALVPKPVDWKNHSGAIAPSIHIGSSLSTHSQTSLVSIILIWRPPTYIVDGAGDAFD
ncbi:hypothetical protein PM082_000046 [Marasmius tenuissimus]|nr:hypothetical protein PM082_000046 [Marasmius tenuissimus]